MLTLLNSSALSVSLITILTSRNKTIHTIPKLKIRIYSLHSLANTHHGARGKERLDDYHMIVYTGNGEIKNLDREFELVSQNKSS